MNKLIAALTVFIAALTLSAGVSAQQVKATDFPPPKPAFPGQTNAPAPKQASPPIKVETVVSRIDAPWALAFLPDGKMLISQRYGMIRTAKNDGTYSAPIAGVPGVKVVAAQSLHDVEIDPDFAHNRLIYFTYFAPPPGEAPGVWPVEYFYARVTDLPLAQRRTHSVGTERVARARLSEDEQSLEDVRTILEGVDRRIVFAPDGTMFITGADRFRLYGSDMDGMEHEFTDPDVVRNFTGRVARINRDGTIPVDNPFMSEATVLPETYSYGLRDPDGAAINPATGKLWIVEHGPLGGDKVEIINPGSNDGWPNVSYGRQYSGVPVAKGASSEPGVDQPVYFWYPDIAPSSALFYTGDLFPGWKGNLLVGSLVDKCLIRLVLDGDRVVAEEHLLVDLGQRIRDVRQAPDGSLYLLTDAGAVLRLTPKK